MNKVLLEKLIRKQYYNLSPEDMAECRSILEDDALRALGTVGAGDEEDMKYHIWYITCFQLSLNEARRIGLAPSHDTVLNHNPIVLVESARGDKAGAVLAAKYGFDRKDPGCMWDILESRRDGDAEILLIGDDRGWSSDWDYFVAVAWSPKEILEKTGIDLSPIAL